MYKIILGITFLTLASKQDIKDSMLIINNAPEGYYETEEEIIEEETEEYIYLGEWITTAYCSCEYCCGVWSDGITHSGSIAEEGRTVACGSLSFGSEIMIDDQIYIVEDTGVEGEWIDIYYEDHQKASDYGIQYKDVYLIQE